jgi:hypothetical protein
MPDEKKGSNIDAATKAAKKLKAEKAAFEKQKANLEKATAGVGKTSSSSDNPFNLKASGGNVIKSLGLYGQGITRAVQGVAKFVGFASAGLLAVDGIAAMASTGTAFGAFSTTALSSLPAAGAAMTAVGGAIPLIGGLMVAGVILNKVFNVVDKKLSSVTGVGAQNATILGTFNPLAATGDIASTVGLGIKGVGRSIKTKGNLAVLAGTGLAAVELGGAYLATIGAGSAIGSAAVATTGFTSGIVGSGLGAIGLGAGAAATAPVMLGVIGALVVGGYLLSKTGKGLETSINGMLKSGQAKGAAPAIG